MAYRKTHLLPTGAQVSHYRLISYRVDYLSREASALIAAYVNESVSVPLVPIFAKLRLEGEKFTAILGKPALAASDADINAALYVAMKSEPVACDAGPDFFRDAEAC